MKYADIVPGRLYTNKTAWLVVFPTSFDYNSEDVAWGRKYFKAGYQHGDNFNLNIANEFCSGCCGMWSDYLRREKNNKEAIRQINAGDVFMLVEHQPNIHTTWKVLLATGHVGIVVVPPEILETMELCR